MLTGHPLAVFDLLVQSPTVSTDLSRDADCLATMIHSAYI